LTWSEWYAILAAGALLLATLINIPALTLGIAGVGLIAGTVVSRRSPLTRAGMVAMLGFAVAAALAALTLLR
jgi:hypothetical protein